MSPVRIVLLLLLLDSGCGGDESLKPGIVLSEGLDYRAVEHEQLMRPMDVVHDAQPDLYLVSHRGGGNGESAGEGLISRVSPHGRLVDFAWIGGTESDMALSDPTGLAVLGDTLYVADRECLRLFDRETGAALDSICPDGTTMILDVAVDEDRKIYISSDDEDGGAILVMNEKGGIDQVILGGDLGRPRGIATGPRGPFAVGSESGSLYQLTPQGPRGVVRSGSWQLEDLVFTEDGSIAFSNPGEASVLFLRVRDGGSRGSVYTLIDEIPATRGLGYDARRRRLLITQPDSSRLFFVEFKF